MHSIHIWCKFKKYATKTAELGTTQAVLLLFLFFLFFLYECGIDYMLPFIVVILMMK